MLNILTVFLTDRNKLLIARLINVRQFFCLMMACILMTSLGQCFSVATSTSRLCMRALLKTQNCLIPQNSTLKVLWCRRRTARNFATSRSELAALHAGRQMQLQKLTLCCASAFSEPEHISLQDSGRYNLFVTPFSPFSTEPDRTSKPEPRTTAVKSKVQEVKETIQDTVKELVSILK